MHDDALAGLRVAERFQRQIVRKEDILVPARALTGRGRSEERIQHSGELDHLLFRHGAILLFCRSLTVARLTEEKTMYLYLYLYLYLYSGNIRGFSADFPWRNYAFLSASFRAFSVDFPFRSYHP